MAQDADLRMLDFFAGSGLVTEAVKGSFRVVWANDIDPRKASVYTSNHGSGHFCLGSVADVKGADLPEADAAWASFPCQDLSLAGPMTGIRGRRSGLVWEWLRVIDEMREAGRRISVLVAENVAGLVSSDHGDHYRQLHAALLARGYVAGALHLDAIRWLPQSRPRVFVVATPADADLSKRSASGPTWAHSPAIRRLGESLSGWVWWKLPEPKRRERRLVDILDLSAPCDDEAAAKRNLSLIPPKHEAKLISALGNGFVVAPGYKRTRHSGQRLELRFDGVAGCLRTPEGGSSRQFLVIRRDDGTLATRLITAREAARMMGARDSYRLPENYNDGYRAMGDAVAVPVARHLSGHLLAPLAKDAKARTSPGRTPHCPWH